MDDRYGMLLDRIHTTDRKIVRTHLFQQKACKICLLDFIGATGYFISTHGVIFSRQKLNTNKNGVVANNWIPLVARDIYYPAPWVCLTTTSGKMWWPVNQLLGWAFSPYIEKKRQYFISKTPWKWSLEHTKYSWVEACPTQEGEFYNFMELLYQDR